MHTLLVMNMFMLDGVRGHSFSKSWTILSACQCHNSCHLQEMSKINNQLWHCINTKNISQTLLFYNRLGLSFVPVPKSQDELFISTLAPLCIKKSKEQQLSAKSMLLWTNQICSEFQGAFGSILQEFCPELEDIKLENSINFNR